MAGGQVIGLQHARPAGNRQFAGKEPIAEGGARRLAAAPGMGLFHQHVVVDIADRERPAVTDAGQQGRIIAVVDPGKAGGGIGAEAVHRRHEEAVIGHADIGQGMRPVFEHGFVDRLRLGQVAAAVGRDAGIEDVMMAALDHVDRVNLDVAEMFDRTPRRLRPGAERVGDIQRLGAEPGGPALRRGDCNRIGHRPPAIRSLAC